MIGEPQPGEALAAGGALADPSVAFFNVGRDAAFAVPSAPAPQSPGATIRSRAEAYRVLAEAADYLLRTEPHSPVPYLVKRAISWGNMSLAELLSEFVASSDDLVTIYRLLGIRGREEG
jgi:predicted component of type VI protein secretion system